MIACSRRLTHLLGEHGLKEGLRVEGSSGRPSGSCRGAPQANRSSLRRGIAPRGVYRALTRTVIPHLIVVLVFIVYVST